MHEEKTLRKEQGKATNVGGELRQEQKARREEGRNGGNGGETNGAFRLVALLMLLESEDMCPAGLGLHAGEGWVWSRRKHEKGGAVLN